MIFSPFERMLASRYLRSKRKEGFINVIAAFSFTGILLGVATLIIVMSVMNGFRYELISRILGINGHINLYGETVLLNYDWVAKQSMSIDGVIAGIPVIENQVLVQTREESRGAVVRGMSREGFEQKPLLVDNLVAGTLNDFKGNGLIIGASMAKRLKVSIGDPLTLLSPQGKASPFGTIPRTLRAEIVGLFDVGMHEYDNNFIFMPLPMAQKFFGLSQKVSTIEITTKDPENMAQIQRELRVLLGDDLRQASWQMSNNSFFTALEVERNVMFLILTLIILVAAFNIISSLIMLVKDKGKEIAILRTMGASRRSIMKIFVLTGASVGLWGTTMGAILGIAFALNIESIRRGIEGLIGTNLFSAEIYFLSQLPARIDWSEVLLVVLMALGLSLLATLYPAWRAAKLDPVEALRYE